MKRVLELDGIRGVAALAVVGFHLAPGFVPLGWLGVDCFFVLSGYLITAILWANREAPGYYLNFYARRAIRIWPIYYLTLLMVLAAYRFLPTNYPINAGVIFQYATYTQHIEWIWFDREYHAIRAYSHTWSLAIEEQFYLLWPLAVRKLNRRGLTCLCIALAVGSVALRRIGMIPGILPGRCDGLALGALLALTMSGRHALGEGRGIRLGVMLTSVVIAGAILAQNHWWPQRMPIFLGSVEFPNWDYWASGPMNALFFGLIGIVILNAGREWLAFLRWRPLVYLGTISYGLYLYHVPVMFAVEAVFRKFGSGHGFGASRPAFRAIIELTITLIVASFSWRFIEKPILRLKSRFSSAGEADARIGAEVKSSLVWAGDFGLRS